MTAPTKGPEPTVFQPQIGMPTGLPPQQQLSPVARTLALMPRLGGMSILAVLAVCVLQAIMPPGAKPSAVLGGFHGETTAAQLNAERDAQVNTAARMADAQARAQAQWAMEVETARQQQAAILQSLQGKQDMATMADYVCMSGSVAGALWGRDAAGYTQAAQAACGQARQLRAEIVAAQAEAARLGSAIMQRPAPILSPASLPPR